MSRPAILSTPPGRASVRFYEPRDRDAVMAIEKKRHDEWEKDGVSIPVADPESREWVSRVVIVDENDVPIAALGARRIAELASTFDVKKLSIFEWRDMLLLAWGKLAVDLWKQGFETAFCKVTSPDAGAWVNMMLKRGPFERSDAPHLYTDLAKGPGRIKRT